jgi:tRNA(fMet)-specific endonuclease VapC
MVYLLDTDSVIFMIRSLKGRGGTGVKRKAQRLVGRIKEAEVVGHSAGISAVTKAELEYGAALSVDPGKERAALEKILLPFDEYDFDAGVCARQYGTVRQALEKKGAVIGAMDLLIAAHALALDAVLVTNNTRHFRRVKGLEVVNWSL